MVYNIKKSDGTPLVSIPDSTQDLTATSLILPGRNSVNFGLSINQNFVDLLQNFSNKSAPTNKLQGQLWYDSVNSTLNVYNGSKWVEISTGFDGSSGVTTLKVGPNNTDITIVVSQYQIITVISSAKIARSDCPDSVVFNDTAYAFAVRFPNGIMPGINLATDPSGVTKYWMNGMATHANVLITARTIKINGAVKGSVRFDGSKDVTVTVTDSNVFTNNSNTLVGGTYTKVLVSNGGRILAGNNLTASDVVTALGYTPYNGGNITVNSVSNSVVGRDRNGNFAANVIVSENLVAAKSVTAPAMVATNFVGTASDAKKWTDDITFYIDGDVYGNVKLDGSTNVVVNTSLVTSGVPSGVYNLVNVDSKGRITNGGYYDLSPFNSIVIFPSDGYIPAGWAECNGQIVVDVSTGTLTKTPQMTSASDNISLAASFPLKYYIKYLSAPPVSDKVDLAAGAPGSGTPVYINGEVVYTTTASVEVEAVSTSLSGGPTVSPIPITPAAAMTGSQEVPLNIETASYNNTTFADTAYFDAVALVMSLGDPNSIMLSENDSWGNFSSLTVKDILENLYHRSTKNLPASAGKYMLPITLIKQQAQVLNIPENFAFTPLLQDQLMSSVTSMFAHQLAIAGIPAVDNHLFGCHYFGSAYAYIEILRSKASDVVSQTLHSKGYYTSNTSMLSDYTKEQLLTIFANIVQISKTEIFNRKVSGTNVIKSGQIDFEPESNVVVKSNKVDGYRIGNSNFNDNHGGFFVDYQILDTTPVATAIIGPATVKGSIGTVTMTLADAGACALAGVLQTDNEYDQVALAQVIINRVGANVTGKLNFDGRTGFNGATSQSSFSGITAAIYGSNSDAIASAKYGNLSIDINILKEVLDLTESTQFKTSLNQVFRGSLTEAQLIRIYNLRQQLFINGPEIVQIQIVIGSAVNVVMEYTADNSDSDVIVPFSKIGYIRNNVLGGFFVTNTSDATASVAAVSPDALYSRLMSNLIATPGVSSVV